MSTGGFFSDPLGDDDDPSQPQPFFGGPLQAALRQQNAGWGNPLLALAGQPLYPGSLVPAGASFAGSAPDRPGTNNVIQLAAGAQGPADQLPQQPAPPVPSPQQPQPAPPVPPLVMDPRTGLPIDPRTGQPIGPEGLKVPNPEPEPGIFDFLRALRTQPLRPGERGVR